MGRNADYTIERADKHVLLIRDVGDENCMSITNDAERVVKELFDAHILRERKLLYIDSEGSIDELKYDEDGNFTGFAPGPRP